jgi:hypothetical protein
MIRLTVLAFLATSFGQPLRTQNHFEHRPLRWKQAGACVVDRANTPCRTVRYREFSFGPSLGSGISKSESVEAVDRSGSESRTTTSTWRPYWLFPQKAARITALVLRTEDRIVVIDHRRRVVEAHRGANRKMPYWEEDDAVCSHAASHYTYLSGRLPDSAVAGVHAVGYRGRDEGGAEYEIHFAPSIGCQPMRFHMVRRGLFGWKTAEYERVVDSYVLGPPAASLFSVPTGYKRVASILQP